MFNPSSWFEQYGELTIAYKIMVPLAAAVVVGLYALLLVGGSRIARDEDFNAPRALAITAIEMVVLGGLAWVLLTAMVEPNYDEWGPLQTALMAGIPWVLVNGAVVVGALLLLGKMSWDRALLTWASRLVIVAHVALILIGIGYVGMGMYHACVQPARGLGSHAINVNTQKVMIDAYIRGIYCLLGALFGVSLWMGGALANIERFSLAIALPLGLIQLAIMVPLYRPIKSFAVDNFGELWQQLLVIGGILGVISLVLTVIVVRLLARASEWRALLGWIWVPPILVLMGGLVIGAAYSGVAIYQTFLTPDGKLILETVAIILMGMVEACVLIVIVTALAGRTNVQRRVA